MPRMSDSEYEAKFGAANRKYEAELAAELEEAGKRLDEK